MMSFVNRKQSSPQYLHIMKYNSQKLYKVSRYMTTIVIFGTPQSCCLYLQSFRVDCKVYKHKSNDADSKNLIL
jgi:hypothetical protein